MSGEQETAALPIGIPEQALVDMPGVVRGLPTDDPAERRARAVAIAQQAFDDAANVFVKAFSIMATASHMAKHPEMRTDRAKIRELEDKAHDAMVAAVQRVLVRCVEKPTEQTAMDQLLRRAWWALQKELKNW